MSHSSIPGSSRFTPLSEHKTDVSSSQSTNLAQYTLTDATQSFRSNPANNKTIPRDYLTSRPRPKNEFNGSAAVPSNLNASTVSAQAGSPNDHPPSSSRPTKSTHPLRNQSLEADEPGTDAFGNTDLTSERTRSPESILSGASVDNNSLRSRTTIGPPGSRIQNSDMPRASSIDSAISSVSATSQQRKEAGDSIEPSPHVIQQLVATAGTAENLILHLLKEKNHVVSQNSQLWKLVEKQRTLLLGLNKDLERVTKDRDKYKKRLKDFSVHGQSGPRTTTQSPNRGAPGGHENAVQAPEIPQHDRAHYDYDDPANGAPGPAIMTTEPQDPVPEAKIAKPVLQTNTFGLTQPSLSLTEPTPLAEKPSKGFGALRKGAPKPLNLSQTSNGTAEHGRADGEATDNAMTEDEQRGRRKTRAEDDKDREKSLIKEQEARSKSAKAKQQQSQSAQTNGESEVQTVLAPPTIPMTLPASPRPPQGLAPAFLDRLVPMALRSPGLPSSPRPTPGQTPFSALPVSPRAPPPGPLSPRAPKQPIPLPMMSPSPFVDPAVIQRQNAMARQAVQESTSPADRLQVHEPTASNEVPPVYQGLVSAQYPNLLLPPNALPSVQIKVASSRLRPSRHSMLGLRTQEDSTVFSLSIYSRASRNELWRVEKIPAVLPQLEQQLRPRCKDLPRLPDRKLFSGHSPAIIDARRQAIDAYFEDLLDVEMDEASALMICKFLSTDVLDPTNEPAKKPGVHQESLPQPTSLNGRVVKTGFLTKRGKNFGGWKSRWFVLDSPELRYYETPGGAHLGTIRIQHAGIGKQKGDESVDFEDQYRHAFLIQEPKKKDLTSYVRHVLCAESDVDRDEWVAALLHYVESTESPQSPMLGSFPSRPDTSSGKEKQVDTKSDSSTPSQTPTSSTFAEVPENNSKTTISAPLNGAPIQDSTQWGNKSTPQPRETQKRGLFNFGKSSNEGSQISRQQQPEVAPKLRVLRHNGYVRAVFGLPLADAVEYCSPFNVEAGIPAVVYRCIEYLRFRNAANEEGLFRLSGSNIVIKQLKERFNTEGDVDLVDDDEYYDVHAVASLFKTYLRELPMSILPRDLHIELLKALEMGSQQDKVAAFNHLVHKLPTANLQLLRATCEYLLEVTENAAQNKMSVRNMGIVFSPTTNIPTPVFNLLLSDFAAIFDNKPKSLADKDGRNGGLVPPSLAPGEIRSPRHQMFSDIPTPAYNQPEFPQDENTYPSSKHYQSSSSEFGFAPLNPSYESGHYVSNAQDPPRTQAVPPPSQPQQYLEGEEQYGSLDRMLVPQGASSDKRRNRESAMFY